MSTKTNVNQNKCQPKKCQPKKMSTKNKCQPKSNLNTMQLNPTQLNSTQPNGCHIEITQPCCFLVVSNLRTTKKCGGTRNVLAFHLKLTLCINVSFKNLARE